MATVYSLICWGGSAGKSVTVNASTDLVTLTNHGLRNATGVAFTSGTLPTVTGDALALNTIYYAKSIAANTFELYREAALTNKIDFTSTGSSLIMKSAYYLGLSDTSRWDTRIYDGLAAWRTGRAGALGQDYEVAEIAQAFDEVVTASVNVNIPAGGALITSMVNGVRSPAFHGGVVGAGYVLKVLGGLSSNPLLNLNIYRAEVDGLQFKSDSSFGVANLIRLSKTNTVARNCICNGYGTSTGVGIEFNVQSTAFAYNNLCINTQVGISIVNYTNGATGANNIVTKCGTGFSASTTLGFGYWFNNISVGNTTNWTATSSAIEGAANNAGLSGEAWTKGTDTRITIATTDFADYAGNNFRPASASSPQTDAAIEYFGMTSTDIAGSVRPSYENGATTYSDVGCYEFDHGFGPWPATATISLTNIVNGTRILITRDDTSAVLYSDVPGTSLSFDTGYVGNFTITARKASATPFYREFLASGTTVANQTTSIKLLQQLDE